ncbi:MAG: hypothetical protein ACRDEA_18775, partial [Microcystaceae cyanobacterium]
MESVSLKFSMALPLKSSNDLVKGKLFLYLKPHSGGMVFEVTSGLPKWQYWGSWDQKGRGVIPPRDDYDVHTDKLWMPNIKGVEGSFYKIDPY